jgi:hypothetical protein
MKLRSDYKDEFVAKHGVKLGLMSCFVKVPASIMCCKPVTGYFVHDFADPIYFRRPLFLHFKTSQSSMLSSMVMTSYTEITLMSVLLLALPR